MTNFNNLDHDCNFVRLHALLPCTRCFFFSTAYHILYAIGAFSLNYAIFYTVTHVKHDTTFQFSWFGEVLLFSQLSNCRLQNKGHIDFLIVQSTFMIFDKLYSCMPDVLKCEGHFGYVEKTKIVLISNCSCLTLSTEDMNWPL